jgi:hypothetical protein
VSPARGRGGRIGLIAALAAIAGFGCGGEGGGGSSAHVSAAQASSQQPALRVRGAALVAAAGDIACAPTDPRFNGGAGTATACAQRATSNLILRRGYDAVLALGDLQYPYGSVADFRASYEPSWGRLLKITHPAPGNHEYAIDAGAGYYDYFGARAGARGRGWYALDIGSWRVLALNSNCDVIRCGRGSPQTSWLRRELRRNPHRCMLAFMHHPRFSSGRRHGPSPMVRPLWKALYRGGADVVLSAHEHLYERFAPLDGTGRLDRSGLTEFVVGTGGKSLYGFGRIRPQSRARERRFGVLELRLGRGRFGWRFVPVTGAGGDRGRRSCH